MPKVDIDLWNKKFKLTCFAICYAAHTWCPKTNSQPEMFISKFEVELRPLLATQLYCPSSDGPTLHIFKKDLIRVTPPSVMLAS